MQKELSLGEYWLVLLKRKWIVIFTFLGFLFFSIVFTWMQTPLYKSSALVRIDQYKSVMNLISDLLRWSPGEIMSTEVETVHGPLVLEKVAFDLNLLKPDYTQQEFNRIIGGLRSKIIAERVERTNMIRIEVSDSNPEKAALIANLVAKHYKDVSHSTKSSDIQKNRQFIEDQLEIAKNRLKKSEEELRAFKTNEGSLSVDSETQLTLERLNNIESELIKARSEREQLETEMYLISSRLGSLDIEQEISMLEGGTLYPHYQKIIDVQKTIDSLLSTHTENNPEIIELRAEEQRLTDNLKKAVENSLEAALTSLEIKKTEMIRHENKLSSMINRELSLIPEKDMQLRRLTREVSVNEELYTMLNKEFKETQIKEMGMISEITVISPAIAPKRPIKPNAMFNIVIGALLGLVLGGVLAALIESFDTSIGAVEDIERLLEVPVLAAVPRFGHSGKQKKLLPAKKLTSTEGDYNRNKALPTIFDPSSAAAEAYRHLRTNLQFDRIKEKKKVYMISSSGSQEGKSVTLSNLSVTLAQSGQRTLLISCNLRRPSIFKIFGISRKPGLTDVLVGSCELEEAVHTFADIVVGDLDWEAALKLPGIDNLSILPAGTLPPNPAELLDSHQLTELIERVKDEYDIILVDAPPTLPVTDSLILGPKADGVLLVYQLGHLPRRALIRAKNLLDGLGIKVVGIVLNDVRPEFHGVAPVYISQEYMKATTRVMNSDKSDDKE
ncbi:MAG TPA: polysaccharide biosynthesis tyrosine autokinase [bacterium]|nr:polysaccharide biosynthesis tyrosine autokinase [bacterium]